MYCNALELIFAAFGTSSQIPETARTAGRCDRRGARTTPRLYPAFSPRRPKSLDFDHFQRFPAFSASGFSHCRSCQYEHFSPTLPHDGATPVFWAPDEYALGCVRKTGHSRDTRLTRVDRRFSAAPVGTLPTAFGCVLAHTPRPILQAFARKTAGWKTEWAGACTEDSRFVFDHLA